MTTFRRDSDCQKHFDSIADTTIRHLNLEPPLESQEIITKIIHVGVGDISEADVMLASASNAMILGFTVKEDSNALAAAEREGVSIKKYDIIYQVLEDIEKTMLSLLSPEIEDVELGKAEGDNWWCVLFPPLCMIEAEESTDVEYTTVVKEVIDKYF